MTEVETSGRSRGWDMATVAVFLGAAVFIILTFRDFAITFDEQFQATYGSMILSWYGSGFHDRSVLDYWLLIYYGGFFDVVAESAARVFPGQHFEIRHLVNAMFALSGVVASWLISRRLAGAFAGFVTVVFVVLTPTYVGHAFANPKDIPFAAMYAWSLYAIVRSIRSFPRPGFGTMVGLSVAIGLTMAIRMAGVILVGYLGLVFAGWLLLAFLRREGESGPERVKRLARDALAFGWRFAIIFAGAWLVMLPWWPRAMVEPVRHPLRTLLVLSRFPWRGTVLFEGQMVRATDLPHRYLPEWLGIRLPEFVMFGLLVGAGLAARWLLANRRRLRATAVAAPADRTLGLAIVSIAALFPPVWAVLTHPVLYDGIRHFLFIDLLLVTLAALAIASAMARQRALPGIMIAVVTIVLLASALFEMVRLHPYEYIYFNRLIAGGLPKASRSYEVDYWGMTDKEGSEWIAAHYAPQAGDSPLRVASCNEPMSVQAYLPGASFEYVGRDASPDLFLGNPRSGCWNTVAGAVVHTIEREGVRLLEVKEVTVRARSNRLVERSD